MFCDLVGSTELSTHFDPEDLQELIRAYPQVNVNLLPPDAVWPGDPGETVRRCG